MKNLEKKSEQSRAYLEQSSAEAKSANLESESELLKAPTVKEAQQTLAELAGQNLIYLDPADVSNVAEVEDGNVLVFYARTSEIPAVENYIKQQKKLLCDIRSIPESDYGFYNARPRAANPGESWYGWFLHIKPASIAARQQPKPEVIAAATNEPESRQNTQTVVQPSVQTQIDAPKNLIEDALRRFQSVSPRLFGGKEASQLESLINEARKERSKHHIP